MVSQKVVIKNPTGLHLRPAGILCKEAMQFKSLITFKFRENTANAKSVLSVLGACVKCGDEIEFVCEDFGRSCREWSWGIDRSRKIRGCVSLRCTAFSMT